MQALSVSQPPARFSRRFGRTYKRLDDQSLASLCCRDVGKIKVDCRFHLSKTQWGVLGHGEAPAAIVYMDFTFDQPADCKLSSAIILVTLRDIRGGTYAGGTQKRENRNLAKSSFIERRLNNLTCLQLTDHYGPKHLSGEVKMSPAKSAYHFTPELNIFGTGIGGVGVTKEKTITNTSKWMFTGNLLTTEAQNHNHMSDYRTLKWELTENEFEARSTHSNVIHTGFAFKHAGERFFMDVEIKGKLQKKTDRIKDSMRRLKFPSDAHKDQGSSTTLVNPEGHWLFTRRIDEIAQGLPKEMERQNLFSIPVQVPDALPACFHDISSTTIADNPTQSSPSLDSGTTATMQNQVEVNSRLDSLPTTENVFAISSRDTKMTQQDPDHSRDQQDRLYAQRHSLHEQCETSSHQKLKDRGKDEPKEDRELEQVLLQVSQFPALIMFIQLLARLLGLFAGASKPTERLVISKAEMQRIEVGSRSIRRALMNEGFSADSLNGQLLECQEEPDIIK